jgi:hypothetical protein
MDRKKQKLVVSERCVILCGDRSFIQIGARGSVTPVRSRDRYMIQSCCGVGCLSKSCARARLSPCKGT